MSFFKELKDDLATAVDELVPEEEKAKEISDDEMVNTLEDEGFDLADGDEGNIDTELLEALSEEEEESADAAAPAADEKKDIFAATETGSSAFSEDAEPNKDVTVITKGTVINGSIISDGSLEVMGTINGDIECLGKLSIIGTVKGNSTAAEVYVNTPRLEGGITSKGTVKIGVGTIVVGDITASSSVIAGAVKGQIDVNGPVIVDSTAVIKGNINAKAVQINNGAVLEGFCSLSYSSVNIDTFFENEN